MTALRAFIIDGELPSIMLNQLKYIAAAWLLSYPLSAQHTAGMVKGVVLDAYTRRAVPEASIVLTPSEQTIQSDTNGLFALAEVPTGRVQVQVSHEGYLPCTSEATLLRSTGTLTLDVLLQPIHHQIGTVEVMAKPFEPFNELATVSARSFTADETDRVAAAINDPGRLVLSYPGVQKGADDAENQIIVRGNGPGGILWRVEGIDVPNPNHFAVIGSAGGGLTIFSAQLLSRSDFFTGAMPAEYGNALSGAFDIRFRRGNDEHREHHVRVGLVGIDVATEGPLRKGRSSYLVNYRYSTLTLLNNMGFNLVGERVNNKFQDISFNLTFRNRDNRKWWTVFGSGGQSEEHYLPVENPEARRNTQPDHWESRLKPANVGIVGATFNWLPDTQSQSHLKAAVAVVGSAIRREYDTLDRQNTPYRYETQRYLDQRLVASLTYSMVLWTGWRLKTGLMGSAIGFDFLNQVAPRFGTSDIRALPDTRIQVQGEGATALVQQYAQVRRQSARWTLDAGYHFLWLTLNGRRAFDPRLAVGYQLTGRQRLRIACGQYSRTLPLMTYFATDTTQRLFNRNLPLLRNRQVVLGWDIAWQQMRVTLEAYWQHLDRVPVAVNPERLYWMLDQSDQYPYFPVVSTGSGSNYGIDAAFEKGFSRTWSFLLNGSLLAARFRLPDGRSGSSVFDTRFSSAATVVKEFGLRRGDLLQVSSRFLCSGGLRYTPLDVAQSAAQRTYIPDETQRNTAQTPVFKRLDLRIAWRYNRRHLAGAVSLDIQNVLNQPYATRVGYDSVRNATYLIKQGELLPLLAFQVDF
jgi:Carboxypeptidase regulatory-like domain